MQPERLRLADENAEDAATARQVANCGVRLGVYSCRQKAFERLPGLVDHAERGVARARELRRSLDDALQEGVKRELGAERDSRLDENPKAVELTR